MLLRNAGFKRDATGKTFPVYRNILVSCGSLRATNKDDYFQGAQKANGLINTSYFSVE